MIIQISGELGLSDDGKIYRLVCLERDESGQTTKWKWECICDSLETNN